MNGHSSLRKFAALVQLAPLFSLFFEQFNELVALSRLYFVVLVNQEGLQVFLIDF